MKFLKKKIQLCKQSSRLVMDSRHEDSPCVSNLPKIIVCADKLDKPSKAEAKIKKRNRVAGQPISKHSARAIKNMAKNFGRAICNFGVSDMSTLYMNKLGLSSDKIISFRNYLGKEKDNIEGIDSFRNMMLIRDNDSSDLQYFKKMFQKLGEIFIKYFSVNWIFDGKVTYKNEYLRYRFKMLRRIQKPDLFTYIK
jgi:hypothetical protein